MFWGKIIVPAPMEGGNSHWSNNEGALDNLSLIFGPK